MTVNEEEAKAAGLDIPKLRRVVRNLKRALTAATNMGVYLFSGGTGTHLRYQDDPDNPGDRWRPLIVAEISGDGDGGDGSASLGTDGLKRAEGPSVLMPP